MNMINGCIDPDIIHAPSLTDLNPGDTFTYQGLKYKYIGFDESGHHRTQALDYPFEDTLWTYDAEVDWLDN